MSLKQLADQIRAEGRGKDTELVHMTKNEVRALHGLASIAGAKDTTNPKTGLPEFGLLDRMLPTILGFGANLIVPGSGVLVGAATGALQNKEDPLMGAVMGGIGGYGGGNLATGLTGMGASAVPAAEMAAANSLGGAQGSMDALIAAKEATMAPGWLQTGAGLQGPTGIEALQAGAQNAVNNPMGLVNTLGGIGPAAKTLGMAAAPAAYDYMTPGQGDPMKRPGEGERREYDYDAGYTGGIMAGVDPSSERQWFNPTYTRRFAEGGEAKPVQAKNASGTPAYNFNPQSGAFTRVMQSPQAGSGAGAPEPMVSMGRGRFFDNIANGAFAKMRREAMGRAMPSWKSYAQGGEVHMESGGFVVPADVVAMAGGGSTDAGLAALAERLGAQPIKGHGDGQSDDIPATIDGKAVARVANGEAYVPKSAVERLGGSKKLYAMLDRVRKQAAGHSRQLRPVDLDQALA